MGLGLGRNGIAGAFCGVGVLCGLEGKGIYGLGGGLELPLLKGWLQMKGLVF